MLSPTLLARLRGRPFYDLLCEATVFLGLSWLCFLSGTTVGLINQAFQTAVLGLLGLITLVWLASSPRPLRTPLALPLAVWIAISVLVAALSSDPRRSFSQVALMLVAVFLFLLAAHLAGRGWNPAALARAVLWVGLILLLLGVFEFISWYAAWLRTAPGQWFPAITYRPTSANVIAMALNLVILLASARLLHARDRFSRAGLILYVLVAFFLLFLTSSRAGWIACAAGLGVLILLAVSSGRVHLRVIFDWRCAHPHLAALALLAAVLAASALGYLLYRQAAHPTHGSFFLSRSGYWPPAWRAFLSSPLHGTGQFTAANALLSGLSIPPHPVYSHAHGSPVNLLAEMGLLGAVAFAYLFTAALAALLRRWRAEPAARPLLMAVLAMLFAFSVHSLFDCFQHEPLGLWLLVFILGLALPARPISSTPIVSASPRLVQSILSGVGRPYYLLLFLAIWLFEVWSVAPLHRGVDLANSNRWPEAMAAFQAAVVRDPGSVIAHQQLGLASAVLVDQSREVTEALSGSDPLDQAIQAYQTVTALEPDFAFNHANLGALLVVRGDLAAARAEFQSAVERAPESAVLWLNLALAAEADADETAALAAFAEAVRLGAPIDSGFWLTTPLRSRMNPAMAAAAAAGQAQYPFAETTVVLVPSAPPALAPLRNALAANPHRSRPYIDLAFALLLQHDGGVASELPEATNLAKQAHLAYSDDPADALDLAWLDAELAAAHGDLPTAAELGRAAWDRATSAGPFGLGAFGQLQYAPRMFRRPAMAIELVPQFAPLPLSAAWGARAETLIGWYTALGLADEAASIQDVVKP